MKKDFQMLLHGKDGSRFCILFCLRAEKIMLRKEKMARTFTETYICRQKCIAPQILSSNSMAIRVIESYSSLFVPFLEQPWEQEMNNASNTKIVVKEMRSALVDLSWIEKFPWHIFQPQAPKIHCNRKSNSRQALCGTTK